MYSCMCVVAFLNFFVTALLSVILQLGVSVDLGGLLLVQAGSCLLLLFCCLFLYYCIVDMGGGGALLLVHHRVDRVRPKKRGMESHIARLSSHRRTTSSK